MRGRPTAPPPATRNLADVVRARLTVKQPHSSAPKMWYDLAMAGLGGTAAGAEGAVGLSSDAPLV